ncbi:MAG: hypothetical protein HY906_14700 [Deltaproteobacteria bacterium]|nr:hypothetical protein [Deltaproteobacteria bacterium]
MPGRAPCVLLALLGVLALASPARGTVALRVDLPELTAAADLVLRGRVVGEVSRWDSSRRRIYTEVTVAVDEVYKGDARVGHSLVVTRLGGSVGGVGLRVAGEVSLAAGEESILFLRRHEARRGARLTVVGMAQGKLAVLRDRRGARVLPAAGGAGLRLVTPTGSGRLRRVATPPAVRPLREVEREIRSLVAARRPAAVRPPVQP